MIRRRAGTTSTSISVLMAATIALVVWSDSAEARVRRPVLEITPYGADTGDEVRLTGSVPPGCIEFEVGLSVVPVLDDADPWSGHHVVLARPGPPGADYDTIVELPAFPQDDVTFFASCLSDIGGGQTHRHASLKLGYTLGAAAEPPNGAGEVPTDPSDPDGPSGPAGSGTGGDGTTVARAVTPAQFEAGRPNVVGAVTSATEAPWDPASLAISGLLAVVVVLLIVFPSELFNSTFSAHYDEIRAGLRRRLAWARRRDDDRGTPEGGEDGAPTGGEHGPPARGWAGFLGMTAATALLYGLLDPGFGPNRASAVLLIGVGAGVAVSTALSAATTGWLATRRFGRADYYFRVLPATLLVAAACVALSRLVGFLPGYLYGLVGGISFRQALSATDRARTVLASTAVVMVAAVVGWLAHSPVAARVEAGSTSVGWLALESILAGTFVAGVEGLLFALLPLRFLSGHTLITWSRPAWAASYAIAAFAFIHLIARPVSSEGSEVGDWTKALALFLLFGAASVVFWAYWRWRDTRSGHDVPA